MIFIGNPSCIECDKPIENHQNTVKINLQQGADTFSALKHFSSSYIHLNCVEQSAYVTQSNSTEITARLAETLGDK